MELSDQELEGLERYFTGAISVVDRDALEKRLKNDKAFSEEAYSFLSVLSTLERGKMKTHEIHLERPLQGSWIRQWWWATAAVLAGLVAGVWWMGWKGNSLPIANESPIAQYAYEAFQPPLSIERTMQISNEALAVYDNREYKRAIPLLQQAFEASKDSLKIFYLSMCYIAENKPDSAISILEKMYSSKSVKAKDPAWYLALAYMMKNEPEKAKIYLKESLSSLDPNIRRKSKLALDFIEQQKQ